MNLYSKIAWTENPAFRPKIDVKNSEMVQFQMFKIFQMIFNPSFTLFLTFTTHFFVLRRNPAHTHPNYQTATANHSALSAWPQPITGWHQPMFDAAVALACQSGIQVMYLTEALTNIVKLTGWICLSWRVFLIMVQQVRLMMFSLYLVDYPMS